MTTPSAAIAVVIPARNEAPRIARVLATVPSIVERVVVVDDGSTDGTADIARRASDVHGARDARIEVVVHGENRGVGAAIATGYQRALAWTPRAGRSPRDAFVVMAGDGQMDPADLPALVAPVHAGDAGYTKGNRFRSPHARAMPLARRAAGEVLSRLTSRAIGVRVSDTQCGYTAIARSACEALDLDALWPRYGYPNDLLGHLARRRIPIREVTVRPIYAGEPSGIRAWHVARIAMLIARAWVARVTPARAR